MGETIELHIAGMDELEREAFSLSRHAEFMAYLNACRERGDRQGSIPLAEARRRLGLESKSGDCP